MSMVDKSSLEVYSEPLIKDRLEGLSVFLLVVFFLITVEGVVVVSFFGF